MMHRILKRLIEQGRTGGMVEKLDVFFAADKLTYEEYNELNTMLKEVE